VRIPEHNHRLSTPRAGVDDRSRRAASDALPCGSVPARPPQVRGCCSARAVELSQLRSSERPCNPRVGVRGANTDLPQPDSTRTPHVACWYPPNPEVGIGRRPRGAFPRDAIWNATSAPLSRASSPARHAEAWRAYRAASLGHPRKHPSSAAPEVPSTLETGGLSAPARALNPLASKPARPESLRTFLTGERESLDGLTCRRLGRRG
jgi:hypothetical protein